MSRARWAGRACFGSEAGRGLGWDGVAARLGFPWRRSGGVTQVVCAFAWASYVELEAEVDG